MSSSKLGRFTYVRLRPKWSAAHSIHLVEYISSTYM